MSLMVAAPSPRLYYLGAHDRRRLAFPCERCTLSLVFKDSLFDAQWLRAVGHSTSGGAEIAECFVAASQIRESNAEDWFQAWNGLAERVFAQGDASERAGHLVSARSSYLRASNYFRTAFTFLIGEQVDPRLIAAYRRHRAAFEAAAALMNPSGERITIPYEDAALHGYLFRAAADDFPRPTLIITGGYDSTAEENYFFSGAAAVERGYTCIVFDGPGQGSAIIENGTVFRPDWEAVIGPVVDYLLTRPEVDAAKIALMGISFGGYLAAEQQAVSLAWPLASPTPASSPYLRNSRIVCRHSSRVSCPTEIPSSWRCSISSCAAGCAT